MSFLSLDVLPDFLRRSSCTRISLQTFNDNMMPNLTPSKAKISVTFKWSVTSVNLYHVNFTPLTVILIISHTWCLSGQIKVHRNDDIMHKNVEKVCICSFLFLFLIFPNIPSICANMSQGRCERWVSSGRRFRWEGAYSYLWAWSHTRNKSRHSAARIIKSGPYVCKMWLNG